MSSEPAWPARCRDRLRPALDAVRLALEQHLGEGDGVPAWPQLGRLDVPDGAALDVVVTAFDLDAFEARVLLLCAGVELDGRIAALCARAHGDPRKRHASFGLALAVLPDAHFRATTPTAALRRWALLTLEAGDGVADRGLRIEERVLHFLGGVSYLDRALEGRVHACGSAVELAPSQARAAERAVAILRDEVRQGRRPLLHFAGATRTVRLALARATSRGMGLSLHALRAADLPTDPPGRASLARSWAREAVLGRSALLIEAGDDAAPAAHDALSGFVDAVGGMLMLSGGVAPELRDCAVLRVEASLPTSPEQRALWSRALRVEVQPDQLDRLVGQFALAPRAIAELGGQARARVDGAPQTEALIEAAWDAARARARPELGALAQCIEPRATWELLVLPEAQRATLREVAAHVRQRQQVYEAWGFGGRSSRGLGISALFAGPSGTGKTMAAEVVARELRLDLVHVDLSSVVSKYIGETEKNLRRIFDAAEQGGAILLFDEADALFGRRSEVKDSHDRYANVEVSYLLQRMEAYRGLAILTTNLADNLDPAFMRRIRFVVRFPYPALEERAEIWQRIFPADTPTAGLDVRRLCQLELPGGNIRNIALHAAFLAAENQSAVTMRHLADAARGELRKIGRPPPERELRGWA